MCRQFSYICIEIRFSTQISKNFQTTYSVTIRPVETEIFLCDQTDTTMRTVTIRNFVNGPKLSLTNVRKTFSKYFI